MIPPAFRMIPSMRSLSALVTFPPQVIRQYRQNPGTHFTAESTEAMRIKSLAQGVNILIYILKT